MNDSTYCDPRNTPEDSGTQKARAYAEADRVVWLHEQRAKRPFEHCYTARNYLHGIKDRLSKREIAYLLALIPLLRRKHWRAITQQAIASRSGWNTRSIKRAQADLIKKGIIAVSHQYRSSRANRKRPSRKASIVWLIGYSREYARYLDCRDFRAVPAHDFMAALSPSARLEIGPKIPPAKQFHTGTDSDFIGDRNTGFIGDRLSPYSFFDITTGSDTSGGDV